MCVVRDVAACLDHRVQSSGKKKKVILAMVSGYSVLLPATVDQKFSPFSPEHSGFWCCSWLAWDDDLPASGCRYQSFHWV